MNKQALSERDICTKIINRPTVGQRLRPIIYRKHLVILYFEYIHLFRPF